MSQKSPLEETLRLLQQKGELKVISKEVDPYLEMADIHLDTVAKKGPAILYEKVKGSPFRAVSNLFGTQERSEAILGESFLRVKALMEFKAHPEKLLKSPCFKKFKSLLHARFTLPKKVSKGSILEATTTLDKLPQVHSWPKDGGAFITLPQVFTRSPANPSIKKANLGMYRIQLSGNDYAPDEIGLHYQTHRTIGVHHAQAIAKKEPLKVSIFVGGFPAHSLSAVLPTPHELSELLLAGALSGRRFRYIEKEGHTLSADADFCIVGEIIPDKLLPEGPFGDHLGYYSLKHPFPVMKVSKVYCRKNAIWPFTVVGRPPQEDTMFGHLIHELTAPLVPQEISGLHALHAVDAAGVHPLMLAIGSERYTPYQTRKVPQELLTIANALLGFGQCSLTKYLFIIAKEDAPDLNIHKIDNFLTHLLERINLSRDLHFQTKTTIDTLDYSGEGLNEGSKLIIAAVGDKKRSLAKEQHLKLPNAYNSPYMVIPGILAINAPSYEKDPKLTEIKEALSTQLEKLSGIPLIIICDNSAFTAENLSNFLWVTFTRSNPSHDVHGVMERHHNKHFEISGSMIIDARVKPHHAPALER